MGKPPLHATVRVFQMSFFRKIITRHDTGLGEAYMDDDFDVRTITLATWGSAIPHLPMPSHSAAKYQTPKSRQAPLKQINSCFSFQGMAVQSVLCRWMTLGL